MAIDAHTTLCCIIGDPVEHSISPQIHNAAYARLGLNFTYLALPVKNVKDAVRGIAALGIRGASVTMPHKQAIIPYLDRLDPLAQKIGAVNTVVNEGGKLIGYNTDGEAAYLSLRENKINITGKKIVLMGAGGAARSIAFTLATKREAGELVIFDLVDKRSQALAAEVSARTKARAQSAHLSEHILASELGNAAVVINASPIGMRPKVNLTPIPKKLLHKGLAVFDIVYNPPLTRLLKDAQKAGCRTVPGLQMLVRQAGEQFRLFTGKNPPLEVMFRAGRNALGQK